MMRSRFLTTIILALMGSYVLAQPLTQTRSSLEIQRPMPASATADASATKTMGMLHVIVRELGKDKHLPCRAWIEAGDMRYFEPLTQSCTPYDKDRSFSCNGEFSIDVPCGKVTLVVERGKEYLSSRQEIIVETDRVNEVNVKLNRWVHMSSEGWYSADWHEHFGVTDVDVLKQLTLADDVNLLPVLGLWRENQPDWPFPADQATVRAGDHYLVTRQNQEIERIGGGPFESVGAPLMYGLTKPVYVERRERTYPCDAMLVRQAKSNSPHCIVDTDKPLWGENVVTMAFGLFDSVQLCHNHYNRGATIPWCCGMADASIEEEQRDWGDDELFHRTDSVYYRWLNLGFKLAATGGSAMGVMPTPLGYNRTYAKIDGPLSEESYLTAIRAGRTFATSGPMLLLTVDRHPIGDKIDWTTGHSKPLHIRAELRSIQPIDSLEILHNGQVIQKLDLAGLIPSQVFKRVLETDLTPRRSGWVAARAIFKDTDNHLRQAHTSPVYITVDGKPTAFKRDAEYMVRWIDALLELSKRPDRYQSDADRAEAQALFRKARHVYEELAQTASKMWGD